MFPIKQDPTVIQCSLNNVSISFELDTGSHVSTLRYSDAMKTNAVITPTCHRVLGYGGSDIKLCGETKITISFNNISCSHTFLVVTNNNVNLFGRDLCTKLDIGVNVPSCDSAHNSIFNVKDNVLNKFSEYLSDSFESNVKQTVSLRVLPGAQPVFCKARSVPLRLKEPVKSELSRLAKAGTISRVYTADWSSPSVNVIKSNGSIRICGDYSATVNQHLNPVNTVLPRIDDIIANVGNATVFSKIDLSNAFLQLPLDDESKKFTTINTSDGLFQYNYLPFGLCASPGIFQSFMLKIVNNIDDVIVYQDDLLILSPSVHAHNVSLFKVLNVLRDAGIKLNIKKCSFFTDSVQYLGHIFDRNGVHPNPEKIRAISDAPAPRDLKQLQAFLGLCNFYSRFIRDFSTTLAPLYQLLKKDVKFVWGQEQQKCFQVVKNLFCSNQVLKFYNSSYETLLECDASGYGIASCLMQRPSNDAPWHPIQFASRSLNAAERNYSNIEREALSIVYGCEHFRKYLLGSRFIIRNDQQPLKKLLAHNACVPTACSARLQRWALRLSQFNYSLEYSKGSLNVNSDCWSRLPLAETVAETEPYELIFTVRSLDAMPVTCAEIQRHTELDADLVQLKHFIQYGAPPRITNCNLLPFKNIINQLSILKGCIMYNNRVFVPLSLRNLVLHQFHDNHPGMSAMKSLARSLIWYPGMDKDIVELVASCQKCQSVKSRPPQNKHVEWPTPPRPWSRLHIDHFFYENKVLLVVVDALSKYIECEIVASTSTDETIEALRAIFSRNGLCDVLVSDNASCFTSHEFEQFLARNSVHHITSPPYSPASNGMAERAVQVIKNLLKKSDLNSSLKTRLSKVLFYYRSVSHSITKTPPSVALNNRKFVTVKDRVNPQFGYVPSCPIKVKKIPQHEVGDNVLALNLRDGPKWYPATIVQKLGINVYNVHVHQLDTIWKRHCNQLLSAPSNPNNFTPSNDDLIFQSDHSPVVQFPSVLIDVTVPADDTDSQGQSPAVDDNQAAVDTPSPPRQSTRIKKPVVRYGHDD